MSVTRDPISVIVIAYNTSHYIRQCLDSLVHQTYGDLEIIVVESGSTDGTDAIADEYAETYPGKVKAIHTPKQGLGAARNTGLMNAKGDYIGFVDSDDWVETDMFERLHRAAVSQNSDMIICDYRVHYTSISKNRSNLIRYSIDTMMNLWRETSHLHVPGVDGSNSNEMKHSLVRSGIGAVWNKLFRKDLVQGRSFPMGVVPEDIEFTVACAMDADKVTHEKAVLYHYRQRETSAMGDMRGLRQDNYQFFDSMSHCSEIISSTNPEFLEDIYDRASMLLFSGKIALVHSIQDPCIRREAAMNWVDGLNVTVPGWHERRPVQDWTLRVRARVQLLGHYRDKNFDGVYGELVDRINSKPYGIAMVILEALRPPFR